VQVQPPQTLILPTINRPKSPQFGDSELGQYIDRLLAKAIVELVQSYQAGSIVIPKLGDMREIIQTEIQTRAEAKIPGSIEAQNKYAKQYRINIHQWSYSRLMDNIESQANKIGIIIEKAKQPTRASPQQQAMTLAIEAYQSRIAS
jgi:IS605 OrfB family transposase